MMTRTMESSSPLHQGVEKTETGTPVRYAPLQRFYSSVVTSTASGSSLSKKIKARKLNDEDDHHADSPPPPSLPLPSSPSNMRVYARRPKKLRHCADRPSSFLDSLLHRFGSQTQPQTPNQALSLYHDNNTEGIHRPPPNSTASASKPRNSELLKLGIDSNFNINLDGPTDTPRLRLRPRTNTTIYNISGGSSKKKPKPSNLCQDPHLLNNASASASIDASQKTKSWVDLSYEDVHPTSFVGLTCKVYWPLDDEWYSGSIVKYDPQTYKHQIQYKDGDNENLNLKKEKIKFHVSPEEMQQFNLKVSMSNKDDIDIDYGEMLVLAATLDECTDLEPGGIIWAKLTGHAVWPAVVVDESDAGTSNDLKQSQGERSIPVQFFGTYDFARITVKQVIPFLKGLLASYHLKCKQGRFRRSLEEAKMYLSEQKLPNRMVEMQNGIGSDCDSASEDYNGNTCASEDLRKDDKTQGSISYPFEIGDVCILSLGKIVTDSEHFRNEQYIWPEGYTAERKFVSVTDPSVNALYKMEVLRHPESKFRPFFRVTMMDNGEQFKGSSPSACWNKIYKRIRRMQTLSSNSLHAEQESKGTEKPGSHMFGFSNPKVHKLIQELSYSRMSSVYSGCMSGPKKHRDLTVGYRPVQVGWKDLDKCNVCHMDEEYENNLFLQCDKCRMMVHSRCYGELQVVNGVLWLCNLCRPGAPESPPRCCLCPVTGGAMKPTTNGLWAHLACAIWIPETCLLDIKRMEPIDGLNRIHKDRWKLLCSICGVSYGACIQCSNRTCRVAYHPLCARAAGLCVELEDEDRLHLMSFDEDEEDQCIRLLSFCKKHRQPTNECSPGETIERVPRCCSSYSPTLNPSGSARCEPYDFLGRRGRKEPEALAAASLKRLYVENRPYLVTGYCQNGTMGNVSSSNELGLPQLASFQNLKSSQHETTHDVLSMAKRYTYMKETFRKRLAFGKSGIHGFGIFAKHPHKAGDMVIEYTGEMVRPSIADRREHFIYNSLVGAGTYMFRIDDERVIDATRAGSIAHLINHSCEPNCYSRSIKVHGDEHIIIFAKRDISEWEELTYDYRFLSIDEQLACYCGFTRCRGVVNDIEAEEHITKLCVPRSKLIDWTSTS